MKLVVVFFVLMGFFGSVCIARSVDIAMAKTQVELTLSNPSSITVNYDIVCHKADGSGTLLSNTAQSLAPNAKININVSVVDSGKCAGNATPYTSTADYNGKAIYVCNGSVNYASAGTLCGVGNSFCMPKSSSNNCSTTINSCGSSPVWVKSETPAEFRVDSCSSYGPVGVGNAFAIRHDSSGLGEIRQSAGEGFGHYYFAEEVVSSSSYGAICCAGGEYSSYCRVTINNTEVEARLLSPSFKSGAAF